MGGESSKADGGDGRAGRRKSTEAINAVFIANVFILDLFLAVLHELGCGKLSVPLMSIEHAGSGMANAYICGLVQIEILIHILIKTEFKSLNYIKHLFNFRVTGASNNKATIHNNNNSNKHFFS